MADQIGPLARLSRPVQWGVLLVASVALATLLRLTGLPAALMLGPMLAAILVGTNGGTIRINHLAQNAAFAVLGCMIAGTFTSEIVGTVLKEWPLCLGVVTSTVMASGLLGWALGRARVIPGSTAVWGLSPGAASVMMLMAEEFGADGRLRRVHAIHGASPVSPLWPRSSPDSVSMRPDPLTTPSGSRPSTGSLSRQHWGLLGSARCSGTSHASPGGLILGPLVLGVHCTHPTW